MTHAPHFRTTDETEALARELLPDITPGEWFAGGELAQVVSNDGRTWQFPAALDCDEGDCRIAWQTEANAKAVAAIPDLLRTVVAQADRIKALEAQVQTPLDAAPE